MAEKIVIKEMFKTPGGVLDYKWDWAPETNGSAQDGETDWLDIDNSETITSPTVTVPNGLTQVGNTSLDDDSTSVVAWLSGGTVNTDYDVPCKIVTSAGRTDTRILRVLVRDL